MATFSRLQELYFSLQENKVASDVVFRFFRQTKRSQKCDESFMRETISASAIETEMENAAKEGDISSNWGHATIKNLGPDVYLLKSSGCDYI